MEKTQKYWSCVMLKDFLTPTVICLMLLTLNHAVHAQNNLLGQGTPKSPNVAGLDKVVEVPASLSTGKISPSIPLYEFKVGNLIVPISLDYSNNGFKPADIPSWVGLGWNLFTGGHISLMQNGRNDFDPVKGLFAQGQALLNSYFSGQMSASDKSLYFLDITSRNIDSEYDEYYYSTPSGNGSFHFISATQARTNPSSDLRISKTNFGFKMIDDNGNTYFFESQEYISSQNTLAVSEFFSDNSAFYLTKIVAQNGEVAEFTYTQYYFQYITQSGSLVHTYGSTWNCPTSSGNVDVSETLNRVYYLLPKSIKFPSGSINFNHSSGYRQDLKLLIGAVGDVPYLSSIDISNVKDEKVKSYNFLMSYFGTNSRLKLDGIAEVSAGTTSRKWEFSYHGSGQNLPPFNSKSLDHWGFANNSSTNSLIALPNANYSALLPNWTQYSPAYFIDKNSDFNSSLVGMLKKITYPTGGTTELDYEGNQFKFDSFNDLNLSPFFQLPSSSINNSIVYGNSWNYYDPANGSFTLPYSGYYKVSSFREVSPDPFYQDASIVIQGNSLTAAALNHLFLYYLTNVDKVVFLEAGTYNYSIHGSEYWDNRLFETRYLRAWMDLSGVSFPATFPVGGNRIKKVVNTDVIANSTIMKKYVYNDNLSNVNFKQMPHYITTMGKFYNPPKEPGQELPNYYCVPCGVTDYTIYDSSIRPLVGNVIEYGKVTTLMDEDGIGGRTNSEFLFSENIGGSLSEPFVAPINTNWRVGKVLSESQYNNLANLKQKITNTYQGNAQGTEVNGLRVVPSSVCDVGGAMSYITALSTIFSEKFNQSSSKNSLFMSDNQLVDSNFYTYNLTNHNKPSSTIGNTSDGSSKISKVLYAFDYTNFSLANSPEANALKVLNASHINAPIEELSIVERNGTKYITGAILKVYKQTQSVIEKIYVLDINEPIPESNFTYSSIDNSGGFIKDYRYTLKSVNSRHDDKNNLLEQSQSDGSPTVYLWSYNGQHIVAKIKNVGYTTVESILGGSSAITTFRDLDNPSTVISNFLAPLRTSPSLPHIEITTYTYEPLVGMTSTTDAKGMTTYYEYDKFQRLMYIKDQNGNIVNSYNYLYKSQIN